VHAFNIYTYIHYALAQMNSGGAAGDFRFSKMIISCDIISFVVGTLPTWLVNQRQHPVFVLSE
jgi:hypothetical protein